MLRQQKRTQLPILCIDFATKNQTQTIRTKISVKGAFVSTFTWTPQARSRVCQFLSKSTLTVKKLQEMWEICKCQLRVFAVFYVITRLLVKSLRNTKKNKIRARSDPKKQSFLKFFTYWNWFVYMINLINTQKKIRVIGTLEGLVRKPHGSPIIWVLTMITDASFNIAFKL